MDNLKWTGERVIPTMEDANLIEHLHRYSFASTLVTDKIVLDIASGEGYGSNILAKNAKTVYGVDIDHDAINHAKKKYLKNNLNYLQGSADQIPLNDDTIDIAISFETIEHLENHEGMCLELKRVLKPEGLLLISSPEKGIWDDNHFHVKELTNDEFKHLMQKYFKNTSFFHQKTVMGSMIVPQDKLKAKFSYHEGNAAALENHITLKNPVFNICIASDAKIDQLDISFFDGEQILRNHMTLPYRNSKIFRITNWAKNIFNTK